jgi:serine/threonine protein phosphatase 1
MATYTLGDLHGNYKALLQVIERSNFDKENDTLVTLGDICDGFNQTPECVDELLTINNRIDIQGNHDEWLYQWMVSGIAESLWLSQGGQATLNSYLKLCETDEGLAKLATHRDQFFKKQHYYHIDDNNRLYVHGGLNWKLNIKEQTPDDLMWDRHAFYTACMWEIQNKKKPLEEKLSFTDYSEVFIGHTCTNHGMNWRIGNTDKPVHVTNLWNLDQGAGWDGRLTLLNVDTKEYFQSDPAVELYPEGGGRR